MPILPVETIVGEGFWKKTSTLDGRFRFVRDVRCSAEVFRSFRPKYKRGGGNGHRARKRAAAYNGQKINPKIIIDTLVRWRRIYKTIRFYTLSGGGHDDAEVCMECSEKSERCKRVKRELYRTIIIVRFLLYGRPVCA